MQYNPSGTGNAVSDYVNFNPWLGEDHYVDSDIAAVNGGQILWEWAAGSTQTYSNEWDNAVAAWNTFNPIDIISATSTLDLVVEEVDEPGEPWVGAYDWEGSPHAIGLNKAKLSNRAPNQIQNTATHELGHALGLLHSYWENIMYPRNTFQTIFGPQDEYDYDYLWND
jgi:predicted Zn-dependent protease